MWIYQLRPLGAAERIQAATEVEIEEYYEGFVEGTTGLTASEGKLTVGVGGRGSKVVKRVYRFKGHNQKVIEAEIENK